MATSNANPAVGATTDMADTTSAVATTSTSTGPAVTSDGTSTGSTGGSGTTGVVDIPPFRPDVRRHG